MMSITSLYSGRTTNQLYEDLNFNIWLVTEDKNNDYARRQIGLLEKEIKSRTGYSPT